MTIFGNLKLKSERQSKYLSAGKCERPSYDAVQFYFSLVEKVTHAYLTNHRAEQRKTCKIPPYFCPLVESWSIFLC